MSERQTRLAKYDAIRSDGSAIAEIKYGVEALGTVRIALMNLGYALVQHPAARAYLVLVDSAITEARLREEWRRAETVLQPEVLDRITICLVQENGGIRGVPADPPAEQRNWIGDLIGSRSANARPRAARTDYEFVVLKVLVHQWLMRRSAITQTWLAKTAGCSYPTVALVLKGLGGLIKRERDRRVSLRYVSDDALSLLLAKAKKARSTIRFVDQSGQPRSPDAHLRRLDSLRPDGVAVGGVVGARHYYAALDLVGTPRLDLSVHCGTSALDVGFIAELDPALRREDDSSKPANVVVHAIRHADPLFEKRDQGLSWADPVECLLDLHEARLSGQASQFFEALLEKPGREDAK